MKEVADEDDEPDFTIGHVEVDYGDSYKYRLNVYTGNNLLTDVIIYDYLEKYAMAPDGSIVQSSGSRDFWTGAFDCMDATDALSKSYIDEVKLYYSIENQPTESLYQDRERGILNDTWHLYIEGETDKADVRSLAIELLYQGKPATITALQKVSVVVRMTAPIDDEINTWAYNGAFTEWTAWDINNNQTLAGMEGINSNIVTVALPNTDVTAPDITIEKQQAVIVAGNPGTKTKDKLTVTEGDVVRYYLTITNTGNAVANDVYITDVIPDGLTLVEKSISDGGSNNMGTIVWRIESLDYREGNNTKTVTFDVTVPPVSETTTWTNQARATYDDNGDPFTPRRNKRSNDVDIEEEQVTTSVTVNKVWEDDGDEDRPESVTVQLYQNGAPYGDPVVLSAAGGWSYTWTDLSGSDTWTVQEVDVPEGYHSSVSWQDTVWTITNTKDEPDTPGFEGPPVDPDDPPVEPSAPDNPTPSDDAPETGDDSNIALWTILLFLSLTGMGITLFSKKKMKLFGYTDRCKK